MGYSHGQRILGGRVVREILEAERLPAEQIVCVDVERLRGVDCDLESLPGRSRGRRRRR
jgi:hypothetical protein